MITSEQAQKYVRIAIYWLAGAAVTYGHASEGSAAFWAGVIATLANFGWTIYGDRVVAKINELAKYTEVAQIKVTDPEIAKVETTPSAKVTTATITVDKGA